MILQSKESATDLSLNKKLSFFHNEDSKNRLCDTKIESYPDQMFHADESTRKELLNKWESKYTNTQVNTPFVNGNSHFNQSEEWQSNEGLEEDDDLERQPIKSDIELRGQDESTASQYY
jgi:hypothetical protein